MSGQSTVDTVEEARVSVAERIAKIEGDKVSKAPEPGLVEEEKRSELEPVEEGQEPAESPEVQQTTEDDVIAPEGGFDIPDSMGMEEVVVEDLFINKLNISEFSRVLEALVIDPEFRAAVAQLVRNGPTIHMAGLSELYKDVVPQEEKLSAEEQAELAEKAAAADEIEKNEPAVVAEEGENPATETDELVAETSVVAEENEPAVVAEEGENPATETDELVAETSVVAEENELAVVAEESESAVVAEENEPAVVAEESESAVVAEESESAVVAEENESAVVAEESESAVVAEESESAVVAEENESAVVAEESESAVVSSAEGEAPAPESLEPAVSPVVTFSGEGAAAAAGVASVVVEEKVEEQEPANDPVPANSAPSPAM